MREFTALTVLSSSIFDLRTELRTKGNSDAFFRESIVDAGWVYLQGGSCWFGIVCLESRQQWSVRGLQVSNLCGNIFWAWPNGECWNFLSVLPSSQRRWLRWWIGWCAGKGARAQCKGEKSYQHHRKKFCCCGASVPVPALDLLLNAIWRKVGYRKLRLARRRHHCVTPHTQHRGALVEDELKGASSATRLGPSQIEVTVHEAKT